MVIPAMRDISPVQRGPSHPRTVSPWRRAARRLVTRGRRHDGASRSQSRPGAVDLPSRAGESRRRLVAGPAGEAGPGRPGSTGRRPPFARVGRQDDESESDVNSESSQAIAAAELPARQHVRDEDQRDSLMPAAMPVPNPFHQRSTVRLAKVPDISAIRTRLTCPRYTVRSTCFGPPQKAAAAPSRVTPSRVHGLLW